jgi:hypothetical protein
MEERRIILEGNIKEDDRLYINFKYFSEDKVMSDLELVGLLTTSLSMTIKSAIKNMDYETQGRLLKDVIESLESDFSSCDSFKDLKKYI